MENKITGKLLQAKKTANNNQKKPKFSFIQYLHDARIELKKVAWPTKKETWKNTGVVIAMSLFVSGFLGLWDYAFNLALEWYLKNQF